MRGVLQLLAPVGDIDLVCLPFAGGSADAFRPCARGLEGTARTWGVDLPGRMRRLHETPVVSAEDAVAEIVVALHRIDGNRPLALYGHSLGAHLAMALTLALETEGRAPVAVILGASSPTRAVRVAASLEDAAILGLLRGWGATPEEVLEDEELAALVATVVRADLVLMDDLQEALAPVDTPVIALAGTRDAEVPIAAAAQWRRFARDFRGVRTIDAGHLFILDHAVQVAGMIAGELGAVLSAEAGGGWSGRGR